MPRRYHGRRIYYVESALDASERAEREEQRFRRRHDRLHWTRQRHPDAPDADRDASADVLDENEEGDEDNEA